MPLFVSLLPAGATLDIVPTISQGPQSTFVNHYDSVNLTCIVSGAPQPSVQWYKDGQPLTGENLQYLYISSLDYLTRGVYNCTVTNRAGTVSDTAIVNINGMCIHVFSTNTMKISM